MNHDDDKSTIRNSPHTMVQGERHLEKSHRMESPQNESHSERHRREKPPQGGPQPETSRHGESSHNESQHEKSCRDRSPHGGPHCARAHRERHCRERSHHDESRHNMNAEMEDLKKKYADMSYWIDGEDAKSVAQELLEDTHLNFTDRVMAFPMPNKFKVPHIDKYDEDEDST